MKLHKPTLQCILLINVFNEVWVILMGLRILLINFLDTNPTILKFRVLILDLEIYLADKKLTNKPTYQQTNKHHIFSLSLGYTCLHHLVQLVKLTLLKLASECWQDTWLKTGPQNTWGSKIILKEATIGLHVVVIMALHGPD